MKKTGLLKLSLLLVLALTMVLGLAACQLKIESMDVVRGEFPEVFARYAIYDVTQLKVRVTFDNGTTSTFNVTKDMVKGMATDKIGEFELTVTLYGREAKLPYKVVSTLSPAVIFDSNGGSFVGASVTDYGTPAKAPKDPTMKGHTFLGWFTEKEGGKKFDFNTKIYEDITVYAHWEANRYVVKYILDDTVIYSDYVEYGSKLDKPNDPNVGSKNEFIGWYYNGKLFDFDNQVVEGEMELVAMYQLKFEFFVKNLLSELEFAKVDVNFYRPEDREAVEKCYTDAVAAIEAATEREAAQAAYNKYFEDIDAYKTYMTLLAELFETYNAEDYTAGTYAAMSKYVDEAIEDMLGYEELEVLPEDIYKEAVEFLAAAPRKDDEKALVEQAKAEFLKEIETLIAEENEVRYSEENWKALNDLVEQVRKDFAEGIDTFEEFEAYKVKFAEAFALIKEYKAADEIVALMAEYKALLEGNEYWAEDEAEITKIYEEALEALREYEAGAPMPATILNQAVEAMGKVMTKEEDIAMGEAAKAGAVRDLRAYYEKFEEIYYSEEKWAELESEYNKGVEAINAAEGTRAVAAAKKAAMDAMAAVERLDSGDALDRLIAAYEALMENEYWAEDLAEINKIYNSAIEAIRSYTEGAPNPDTIADQAIAAMEKVMTKAEDIEAGDAAKAGAIRELTVVYEGIEVLYYTDENLQKIIDIYEAGVAAINAAQGTRAVAAAKAEAIEAIKAVPQIEYTDAIDELVAAFEAYNEEDYFEEDYLEIAKIYLEAVANIRAYEGGAPTPETIVKQAKEAMDKVMTKEEDIEAGNLQKDGAIRELRNYYESLNELDYTEENWKTLTNIYTTGIEGIRLAEGTRAVAAAKADALRAMEEIPQLSDEVKAAVAALAEAYNDYNEEDYFAEDYAEITKIYEEALEALREYEGGAPSPATILNQAVEAMGKVMTKEEDIAMGEAAKDGKIRELRVFYEALNALYYSEENWKTITNIYTTGIEGIRLAEGTRAVAAAYGNAVESIRNVPELETKESIMALVEAFNAYDEEVYFEEDYAEIVKIYEEALVALREYEGGAPTPETILNQAVTAMDKVMTREEDIEAGNLQKAGYVNQLKVAYAAYEAIMDNYSDENWKALTNIYTTGIEGIRLAEGTRAVAKAYGDAVEGMKAVEVVETLAQINALKEYYEAIDKNDYFAAQQEELKVALAKGVEMLRTFVAEEGSEKTADDVLAEAKALLDAVNNKEKDREIANGKKAEYKQNLQNYVDSLNQEDYTAETWALVQSLLEQGKANIDAAEGTAALQVAYDATIAAIEKAINGK